MITTSEAIYVIKNQRVIKCAHFYCAHFVHILVCVE